MLKKTWVKDPHILKNECYQRSVTGDYRDRNEDAIKVISKPSGAALFIICDGMGGHPHGDFASQFTAQIFNDDFLQTDFTKFSKDACKKWLRRRIYKVRSKMILKTQENKNYNEMGTVLTACLFILNELYWVHLGDTRLYCRREGITRQITKDQNVASSNKNFQKKIFQLANQHSEYRITSQILGKMLTSSLGPDKPFTINEGKVQVRKNDTFYLSTDGLHDFINPQDLSLGEAADLPAMQKLTDKLFENAVQNGSRDNISLIIFNFQ